MHLKVFVKLKKTLKTLSSGQKNPKKPKNPKKLTGLGFFLKTRVFSNPDYEESQCKLKHSKKKILTGRINTGVASFIK
jgi:hypothetical protein